MPNYLLTVVAEFTSKTPLKREEYRRIVRKLRKSYTVDSVLQDDVDGAFTLTDDTPQHVKKHTHVSFEPLF